MKNEIILYGGLLETHPDRRQQRSVAAADSSLRQCEYSLLRWESI